MTQCAMMVAPAALSSTELTECLDPSVAALIAEVDAILCAAEAPDRRRPTPPSATRRPFDGHRRTRTASASC